MAPLLTHSRPYALTLATLTLPYELLQAFIMWLLWDKGGACCETVPSFAFPKGITIDCPMFIKPDVIFFTMSICSAEPAI